eukprot:4943184-Prymnesium_polylepis.1
MDLSASREEQLERCLLLLVTEMSSTPRQLDALGLPDDSTPDDRIANVKAPSTHSCHSGTIARPAKRSRIHAEPPVFYHETTSEGNTVYKICSMRTTETAQASSRERSSCRCSLPQIRDAPLCPRLG